jgi:hydroxysqualene synthase
VSLRAEPLAEAYAVCDRLARSHYENFPVASRLLPAAMRPHVAALYAFARIADDLADEGTAPAGDRLARLRAWQEGLHRAARRRGTGPRTADRDELILAAIGHSIRTLDLPLVLFDDLVSAFGQDTMTSRYDTWCDVLDYCRRSANPVGRLVLRIAGYADADLDRSSDALCTALQLTNFWQDLGDDWRMGRLYVPREVQDACGATEIDLASGRMEPAWARAIEACAAFTRSRFEAGRLVCDGVRGRLRIELRFTWLGGMRMLDRVERGRINLLNCRPALGIADAPRLVWQAFRWPTRRRRGPA